MTPSQTTPWTVRGLLFLLMLMLLSSCDCNSWLQSTSAPHIMSCDVISYHIISYNIIWSNLDCPHKGHLFCSVLCCSVLFCAMLCYAVLCYAMLFCAMLCYAMLCYAMLCNAVLCYDMLCCSVLCYAVLWYAMICYAMLCYAVLCYAMLWYAVLCYAMLGFTDESWSKKFSLTAGRSNNFAFYCEIKVISSCHESKNGYWYHLHSFWIIIFRILGSWQWMISVNFPSILLIMYFTELWFECKT